MDKFKILFTKHELWALKWAQRLPLFALFWAATLWVWIIIPVLLTSPVLIFLFNNWPIVNAVAGLLLGMAFLFFIGPWFFRWYFICTSLMFGRSKMSNTKRTELKGRLKLLNKL